MNTDLFQMLASYNRWANARLYAAALTLPEASYRQATGIFFASLHGTLNHLLVADRIWLKRLTGAGEHPDRLDAIIYDNRTELARARLAEDERIVEIVHAYDAAALAAPRRYRTMSGQPQEQKLADILMHVFNHQTHHRGQAHACCSIVADAEPPSLDLLLFQRGAPAPDLRALV